ncbi:hypothetical protein FGO68_gene15165 [Halteria grandinella]|uniref:Uncharacterized protein n=1 Tax=Halteria grandinella TaxID=5974 RepID=A0A8J8T0P4_HALGN|nr:hypothetical protein FGO68_gene15165 [Halteria grandinella]
MRVLLAQLNIYMSQNQTKKMFVYIEQCQEIERVMFALHANKQLSLAGLRSLLSAQYTKIRFLGQRRKDEFCVSFKNLINTYGLVMPSHCQVVWGIQGNRGDCHIEAPPELPDWQ